MLKCLPENAFLERLDVDDDVWQFGQELGLAEEEGLTQSYIALLRRNFLGSYFTFDDACVASPLGVIDTTM